MTGEAPSDKSMTNHCLPGHPEEIASMLHGTAQ
jgi:hypothetical protein